MKGMSGRDWPCLFLRCGARKNERGEDAAAKSAKRTGSHHAPQDEREAAAESQRVASEKHTSQRQRKALSLTLRSTGSSEQLWLAISLRSVRGARGLLCITQQPDCVFIQGIKAEYLAQGGWLFGFDEALHVIGEFTSVSRPERATRRIGDEPARERDERFLLDGWRARDL